MSDGANIPAPSSADPRRGRRSRLLRLAIWIVEGIAAFAGLAMLAAALLALRLAWGPLEVDWLAPALSQVLNAAADPLSVTMGGASMSWGAGRPTVDLVARDLHVVDPSGTEVLTLPRLAASLSVKALLEGRIAPTSLVATGPQLHVIREADGSFGVVPDAVPDAGEIAEPWPQMLRGLAGKPRPGDPLSVLDRVSVVGMEAMIEDRANGLTSHLSGGTASAIRSPKGLEITIGGRLGLGNVATDIKAVLHLDTAVRAAIVDLDFSEFMPAGIADSLPGPARTLASVQFGIKGTLTAALDVGTMQIGRSAFILHGGAGALVDPRLAGGRLPLRSLDVDAEYDPAARQVTLRRLALDLDGPTIETSGTVEAAGAEPLLGLDRLGKAHAKGKLTLRNLPLDRFAALWPPGIAPNPRAWITRNLSVGKVDALDIDADATIDPDSDRPITVTGFNGTLGITGGRVNYLDGLPRLEGVDATIGLSPQKLDIAITAGRMQGYGLTIPKATAVIDGFDETDQRITLDIGIKGPATDVMSVIDVKRLQYAKAIGMAPDRVAGMIDGTLHFRFRLKNDLPFSEVEYGAQARLTGLSIVQAALGSNLDDGSFNLMLDHDHVSLDGDGKLGGVPVKLTWAERISGTSGDRSTVHAIAQLDENSRRLFGFDYLPGIVHGKVDADIDYRVANDNASTVQVGLDLTQSDLAFDLAGWSKAPGLPADARFRIGLQDGVVVQIVGLEAHAPGLDLAGGLDFHDGKLVHGTIGHLVIGNSDLTGSVDHGDSGPWAVTLRGKTLDFDPVRKSLTGGPEPAPDDDGPSLTLDVACDKVLNGPDHVLRQLTFSGSIGHHALLKSVLHALIGSAGKLDFHLDPVEQGGAFAVATDDFGALFKAGGITDNLIGGRLSINGTSKQEGDARRFTGHIEGKDYRIVNMPFLARLLSLASFQSVSSLMAGQGIPFTALKSDLTLKEGILDIKQGRAYGGALGVQAKGWIDTRALTLSLSGTLVPAYTFNSILGNVPLLGRILVGPEGSGIVAANANVSGHLAEPDVQVDPISVLVPGFLKDLLLWDTPAPERPKQ